MEIKDIKTIDKSNNCHSPTQPPSKKGIDKLNMRKAILDFPKQFEKDLGFTKKIKGNFENVIICGMGGSTIGANLLVLYLKEKNELRTPIIIHRSYGLPKLTSKKSLIIPISFSGNTAETISSLKEAIKKKFKVIPITTNGKIEKICKKNNILFLKIPKDNLQPRMATGYLFSALLKIFREANFISEPTKNISLMVKNLKVERNYENLGKKIAKSLIGSIPLIYASERFKSLAYIWKIKFNENSKTPAFCNYFPELNHNEMVGFEKAQNFHILILRDKDDDSRILKRMKLFSQLMRIKKIKVDFIEISGKDILYKIFSTLALGDWVSYYLALEYKVDPTPVKIIEEFKKKLKE